MISIIIVLPAGRQEGLPTEQQAPAKKVIFFSLANKSLIQNVKFDFHIQTKPIAQLTHLIYQQKLQGFDNVIINISGGLRYMVIWLYIGCSITNTRVIHGDFIYEGSKEVGIYSNMNLPIIPFQFLTDKQFEFLELFFNNYNNYRDFFKPDLSFNDNSLLSNRIKYNSLEILREALEKKREESLTRGSINGYIQILSKLSALRIYPNPDDKKEKTIEISYLGMAYFFHKVFIKYSKR